MTRAASVSVHRQHRYPTLTPDQRASMKQHLDDWCLATFRAQCVESTLTAEGDYTAVVQASTSIDTVALRFV